MQLLPLWFWSCLSLSVIFDPRRVLILPESVCHFWSQKGFDPARACLSFLIPEGFWSCPSLSVIFDPRRGQICTFVLMRREIHAVVLSQLHTTMHNCWPGESNHPVYLSLSSDYFVGICRTSVWFSGVQPALPVQWQLAGTVCQANIHWKRALLLQKTMIQM